MTIFFLVPGFFAVQVFRFLLVEDELSTFELTTWSVVLSVLGPMAQPRDATSSSRTHTCYDVERDDFYSDGSKYVFIRGSHVQAIRLMVAAPPARADEPLPQVGYLRARFGTAMMSERSAEDGDEPASTYDDREQEGPHGSG